MFLSDYLAEVMAQKDLALSETCLEELLYSYSGLVSELI